MTQPSLSTTFDTSLIDLGTEPTLNSAFNVGDSFSTTESMPSEKGPAAEIRGMGRTEEPTTPNCSKDLDDNQHHLHTSSTMLDQPSMTNTEIPVKYLPTVSAYDSWAKVYDTDGNILQKVDDLELETLLPEFLALLKPELAGNEIRIADLGCGTGRNTLKLVHSDSTQPRLVTGIDASRGMLALADKKLSAAVSSQECQHDTVYRLVQHDFLNQDDVNAAPVLLNPAQIHDGLLSTLVLEHFPLEPFFTTVRSLVRPGGVVILTNMHSEMGSISQAGFINVDEHGQEVKVRGTSWAHGAAETADAARRAGFSLAGNVLERAVSEDMLPLLGPRAKKWVGIKVWYGMILIREG